MATDGGQLGSLSIDNMFAVRARWRAARQFWILQVFCVNISWKTEQAHQNNSSSCTENSCLCVLSGALCADQTSRSVYVYAMLRLYIID